MIAEVTDLEAAHKAASTLLQTASEVEIQRFFPNGWEQMAGFRWWIAPEQGFMVALPVLLNPDNPKHFLIGFTAPDHRRSGVCRALMNRIEATLIAEGQSGIFTARTNSLVPSGGHALTALGFTEGSAMVEMEGPSKAYPEPDEKDGIRYQMYQGGDEALNAEIAALEARLYAVDARSMVALNSVDPARFSDPNRFLILAFDADNRLIGEAEGVIDPAFATRLGVARSHWGKGVADELSNRVIGRFAALGIPVFRSMVRETNHASIRMQKRVGLTVVSRMPEWTKPLGSAPMG
ncbi:MAG: GNAT family N-acetyltransferase [Rhodospirillaceae bacterium]